MAVPEEIRKVPRPKNTIVDNTGKPGKNQYPVRERSSVKYEKGSNPKPRNGKVIGHIIDGKFVPVVPKVKNESSMLSYGTSTLIYNLSKDIMDDLLEIYPINIADTIMAIAALKIEKPSISASRYASRYEASFTSRYFPNAALSESSVSRNFVSIGKDFEKRQKFFNKRMSRIAEDEHILIDGTLKENNSIVNDLSHYSFKSRIKGTKDISLLYAYSLETHEPICCEVFPGNHPDQSAYANFLRHNNINEGIIIDDKGFPVYKIEEILKENPNLHYLTPIKRNDSRIKNNNMLEFDEVISGIRENVMAKKQKIRGDKYLYAFKDSYKASLEKETALSRAKETDDFDGVKFREKEKVFGVIVYESDMDMSCKEAYQCYKYRWELELLFKTYKSELSLTSTNVHNDFSIYASEFVNFISTLITERIIKVFKEHELLDKNTYGNLIEDLNSAWRFVVDENDVPSRNDSNWIHVNVRVMDLMKKIGLCR